MRIVRVWGCVGVSARHRAERLRYVADGFQVRLELEDCPMDVMVTGSCTLDPMTEHVSVAQQICQHVGLDPDTDLIIEATEAAPGKEHKS